jgi:hypothetical protein
MEVPRLPSRSQEAGYLLFVQLLDAIPIPEDQCVNLPARAAKGPHRLMKLASAVGQATEAVGRLDKCLGPSVQLADPVPRLPMLAGHNLPQARGPRGD